MSKIICDITTLNPSTDLGSFIRSQRIKLTTGCLGVNPVVNDGLIVSNLTDQNNCNLCPSDLPFFNLVNTTDRLNFQFQQVDNINGQNPAIPFTAGWEVSPGGGTIVAKGEVIDCCTDAVVHTFVTDVAANYYVGLYELKDFEGNASYTNIQAIEINPNLISSDCFYFKFEIRNVDNTGFDVFYSEPFVKNTCNDQSVLIEGFYTPGAIDDFGYYYGDPVTTFGTAFKYSNAYRIRGQVQKIGDEIEKAFVNNVTKPTQSQRCENYALRLYPAPEYAATKIANNMNGKQIILNETPGFEITKGISKNKESGNYWIVDTELQICGKINDFSCDC